MRTRRGAVRDKRTKKVEIGAIGVPARRYKKSAGEERAARGMAARPLRRPQLADLWSELS